MFYKQLLCAQIPKAQKKTDNFTVFFALSGSACEKDACEMLVKFTTGVNFINILCSSFWYKSVLCSFSLVKVWLLFFGASILVQNLLLQC